MDAGTIPVSSKWKFPILYGCHYVLEEKKKTSTWKEKPYILSSDGKLYHFKTNNFTSLESRKSVNLNHKKYEVRVDDSDGTKTVVVHMSKKKTFQCRFPTPESHNNFIWRLEVFSKYKEYKLKSADTYFVLTKLEKMVPEKFQRKMFSQLKFFADCLSYPNKLKATYLNIELDEKSHLGRVPYDAMNFKGDNNENAPSIKRIICYDDFEYFRSGYDINLLRKSTPEKFKMPFKIVFSEVYAEGNKFRGSRVEEVLGLTLGRIPPFESSVFKEFELCVVLGPFYLQFSSCGLVIPRRLTSFMFNYYEENVDAVPFYTYIRHTTFQEVLDKLATVVCKWNTKCLHSKLPQGDYVANSCNFVDDLVKAFGIRMQSFSLEKAMDNVRKTGSTRIVFYPSDEFKANFKLTEDEYAFETHAEIDEFLFTCSAKDEIGLNMDYKKEYSLLKSFDRLFWLRYYMDPSVEKFAYHKELGCYFPMHMKFVDEKRLKKKGEKVVKAKVLEPQKFELAESKAKGMKLSDKELMCVFQFLEVEELREVRMASKQFFNVIGNIWTHLFETYYIPKPEPGENGLLDRKSFLEYLIAPKVFVLFTSLFLTEEEIVESFEKHFPYFNKGKLRFLNIHMRKLPCFSELLEFDMILIFGGSNYLFEHDNILLGNRLYNYVTRDDKCVINLMFCNWLTDDEINKKKILDGKWKKNDMFLVGKKGNFNEGINEENRLEVSENYKHLLGDFEGKGIGSHAISPGELNKNHARLMAKWTVKKQKETREYVALAESCRYKLIHCNMWLHKETVDLTWRLARYLLKRKKVIEEEEKN